MKKLISLLSLAMLLSVNVLTPISYATENLGETEIIPENGSGISENGSGISENEIGMSENDNMSFRGSEATEESSKGQTGNTQDFYSTSGASASPQNGEGNGQTPQSDNNVSSGTVAKDSEISPLDEGGTVELSEFELQDSSVDTGKLQLDEHYIQNQEEYIEENSLYVQQMQGNKDDSVMMMRNIANYEDGIYDVLDRTAKTVKYGDILLTISMTDKSVNGYNLSNGYDLSTLGGEGDNADNKYDSQNDRSLRRGPCDEGWHVPSQGELVNLIYSWCMIDGGCYLGEFLDDEYIRIQLNESNMWDGIMSIVGSYNSFEINTPGFNEFGFELSDGISWIDYNTSSYNDDNGAFFLQPYNGYVYFYNSSGKIVYNSYGDYGNGFLHYFRCFKDSAEIEDVYYNLDFNVDGEIVDTQTMQSGKRYQGVKIADPQKEGYVFDGWYEDPGFGGEERNFDNGLLKDTVIYAKWLKTYNIDFVVDDKIVNTQKIISGNKGSGLKFYRKGYIIDWYEDPDFGGEVFDFSTPINADITLYAKRKKTEKWQWQTLFIPDPNDDTNGITIMDRNLGAENILKNGVSFATRNMVNLYNDNEWGGNSDSSENGRGLDLDNDEDRQGPCPDGWHVPSIGEWNKVLEYWREGYSRNNTTTFTLENDDGLGYLIVSGSSLLSEFLSYLKIYNKTLAGCGEPYTLSMCSAGGVRLLSSSVPNDNRANRRVIDMYFTKSKSFARPYLNNGYIGTNNIGNSATIYNFSRGLKARLTNGGQIRCFANKKQYIIFHNYKGSEILSNQVILGEKYSGSIPNNSQIEREGYSFLGWSLTGSDELFDFENELVLGTSKLYPQYVAQQFTVTFVDEDGTELETTTQDYDTDLQKPANPTKEGYIFLGWKPSIPETMPAENLTITAQWKKKSSSWSGGGGSGGGMRKDNCPDGDFSPSYYDGECGEKPSGSVDTQDSSADKSASEGQTWSVVDSSAEPQNNSSVSSGATAKDLEGEELFNMHKWAYDNGLTIYKPGEDAKFDQPLTRQQMAKISSIFGAKFLNQKADATEGKIIECSQYKDLSKSKGEMRGYVIQSCLLGNMGYAYDGVNLVKKFNPYNKLTVAQASVILSRMAWGDKYVISPKKWYQGHMYAVYDHGLIDDISNPQREITRGEAFMMMYRLSQMMETEKQ